MNKKLIYAFIFSVVSSTAYAMASFFLLPGWNTAFGSWNNDYFIDASFWPQVGLSGQIVEALYGTSPADLTAYTQYWSGTHTCTNMEVDVIQSGLNTIPEFLSGNTIYVLDEGIYTTSRTINANDDCTAIIGYQNVEIYSSVMIASGTINSFGNFNIFDAFLLNGEDDGTGSPHALNSNGLIISGDNQSFNNIDLGYFDGTALDLRGSYFYVNQSNFHNTNVYGIQIGNQLGTNYRFENLTFDSNVAGVKFEADPGYGAITNVIFNNITGTNHSDGFFAGRSISGASFSNMYLENNTVGIGLAVGTVSGFVSLVNDITFTNITISGSNIAMLIASGAFNIDITQLNMHNSDIGLDIAFSNNVLIDSTQGYNVGTGLSIVGGSGIVIQNAGVTNNTNYGMYASGVSFLSLENTALNTGSVGFHAQGMDNLTLQGIGVERQSGGNGIEIIDSNDISLTSIYSFISSENGIEVRNSTNVTAQTIEVLGNGDNGLSYFNVTGGSIYNVKGLYNSGVGVEIFSSSDITAQRLTLGTNSHGLAIRGNSNNINASHIVAFNNEEIGIGSNDAAELQHIAISNAVTFNNEIAGLHFDLIENSSLSNIYSFNNSGVGLFLAGASGLYLNDIRVANSPYGIYATSGSINNEYFGEIFFQEVDNNFCYSVAGNTTCDSTSMPYTGFFDQGLIAPVASWSAGVITGTADPMTCHQAINPIGPKIVGTGIVVDELLSYPYCNELGYDSTWATLENKFQFTFFEDAPLQKQTVGYDGLGSLIHTGSFDPDMFIGDIPTYPGMYQDIGGHAFATGEVDTMLSGGLIYKNTYDTISTDLYLNTAADHIYTIEGDVMSIVTGDIVGGTTGDQFDLSSPNGIKVIRTSYAPDGGAEFSNYYGIMRFLNAIPAEFDFTKTLLTPGPIYPGSLVTFRLEYEYTTGTLPAMFYIYDMYQTGLNYISSSPVYYQTGTLSGNQSLARVYSGIMLGNSGSIDVTFEIDPGFTGTSLSNTGIIADHDTLEWFNIDDVVVPISTFSCTGYVGDVAPDAFDLGAVNNASIFQYYQSSGFTVVGIDTGAVISITGGAAEYRINSGSWVSGSGLVFSGDYVEVRMISPLSANSATATTLTIGCVLDTFIVSTAGVTSYSCPLMSGSYDMIPETYLLGTLTNQSLSSYVTTSFVLTGVGGPTPVAIAGGEYRINGGPWMTVVGQADQGDMIEVRLLTSASYSASRDLTLTVGCVSDAFEAFNIPQPPTGGGGGGGGGGTIFPPDDCPDINGDGIRNHLDDLSPSRYDHICTGEEPEPTFPSAPIRDETDIGPAYYFMAPYELPKTGVGRILFK